MKTINSFHKFQIQAIYNNLYQITCIDENDICYNDYAQLHEYLHKTFSTSAFTQINSSFIVNEHVYNVITK